jgi:hypothetical protein
MTRGLRQSFWKALSDVIPGRSVRLTLGGTEGKRM